MLTLLLRNAQLGQLPVDSLLFPDVLLAAPLLQLRHAPHELNIAGIGFLIGRAAKSNIVSNERAARYLKTSRRPIAEISHQTRWSDDRIALRALQRRRWVRGHNWGIISRS